MREFWKRKLPAFLLAAVMMIGMAPAASAEEHTDHTPRPGWERDDNQHWQICSVGGERVGVQNHDHAGSFVSQGESGHFRECSVCHAPVDSGSHTYQETTNVPATCVDGKRVFVCTECKYEKTEVLKGSGIHDFNTTWSADATHHWHVCTICKVNKDTPVAHSFTSGVYTSDASGHWQICTICGGSSAKAGHVDRNGDGVCDTCQRGGMPVSSTSNQNIEIGVDGGRSTTVGSDVRSKVQSLFSRATGRTFTYISFGSVVNGSSGTLYANSGYTALSGRNYAYSGTSYPVTDLYFEPANSRGTYAVNYSATDGYSTIQGVLSIVSGDGNGTTSGTKITYSVRPGSEVRFDREDFNRVYQNQYNDTVKWVEFTWASNFSDSDGILYYNYGENSQRVYDRKSVQRDSFYYSSSSNGNYPLDDLSFVADSGATYQTISLEFRAFYSSSRYVDGTLDIKISDTDSSGSDLSYTVEPGGEVEFDGDDFDDYFQDSYSRYSLRYITFSGDGNYNSADGSLYYNYGERDQRAFDRSDLNRTTFYYGSSKDGDYDLDALSFVADSDFEDTLILSFRAYYDYDRYVDGTLSIKPKETENGGDIRYYTTYNGNVQLNPNDFVRFVQKTYPNNTLQYVKLEGVPSTGSLYYNYYSASSYGPSNLRLTTSNYRNQNLYFSPSTASQYALSELTYLPSGSNYCAAIPFAAYTNNNRSVRGTVLISVNASVVPEVYGVIPVGTSVSFPAGDIYSAVSRATGAGTNNAMAGIQLLELPDTHAGTIYVGTSNSVKANTTQRYTYTTGNRQISQLRFQPAVGFTGSVEIPYVAYNSAGKAIASGKFALGVVNSVKRFTDVGSSVWCYKYVAELSDAKVIDGYPDGRFYPDKTVTYGQALKLILLAANYSVQTPTGSHPFSGYLTRAKTDGLISGVNESDLDKPITRLAVAQLTAKAMKLSTSGLSNVRPFTDTTDVYVQALNAAGIVEGYFNNGKSTFQPSGTMTRGQISAIVWRMERSKS